MKSVFYVCLFFVYHGFLKAQESATILEERVLFSLENNLISKHVYQKVKLHTPASYRTFGEWFFSYNPQAVEVEIIQSKTTQVDGTVIPTPENGILLQSPYATMDAPDFSFMREYMVSHTGLEPGCTIEFEYVIRDIKPWRTVLFEPMEGYFPIESKVVSFEGFDLNKLVVNGPVERNDSKLTLTKAQAIILDPHFSKTEDLSYVALPLVDFFEVMQQRFEQRKGLMEVLNLLNLHPNSHILEVQDHLRHLLNDRMATVDLSLDECGFYVRTLNQIAQSGYATDWEKTHIAVAVLHYFNQTPEIRISSPSSLILMDPSFRVLFNGLPLFGDDHNEYASSYDLHSKKAVALSAVSRSVLLSIKEQSDNKWTGVLLSEDHGIQSNDGSAPETVKGLKVEKSEDFLRTPDQHVSRSDVAWTCEDNRIELSDTLFAPLKLDSFLEALQSSDRVTLSHDLLLDVKVVFEFLESKVLFCPGDLKVVNRFGKTVWKNQAENKEWTFILKFDMKKGTYSRSEFKDLEDLIGPMVATERKTILFEDRKSPELTPTFPGKTP